MREVSLKAYIVTIVLVIVTQCYQISIHPVSFVNSGSLLYLWRVRPYEKIVFIQG